MYKYLLYTIIVFSSIYLINIIRFIIGMSVKNHILENTKIYPVSIIIAVKNGEANLLRMLKSLSQQSYDGNMEFIIIDDNSIDETKNIINNYISIDKRVRYVNSIDGASYLNHKKKALDAGICKARYEYLLFTDIDCIIQPEWVKSMMSCFSEGIDYVAGHAYVYDRTSILNKFQRIDLLMLLFSAKSMIASGNPWASIGQNQAYTKTLYARLEGFKSISKYLQGDDTLFLQLAVHRGAKVIFNNNPKSYVVSRTELSWNNLLLQRGRWSGDANIMWRFNMGFYIMALSLWIMSAGLILLIVLNYFKLLLVILFFKILFESLLYILGSRSFLHSIRYFDFLIWFMIHPLYVFIMGISSFFNFEWKGARFK